MRLKQKRIQFNSLCATFRPSDGLQMKYLQNVKGNVKNMEKDKHGKLYPKIT